ncbi:MAG TPA: helix-turn-helix domain-containing protein [Mycobacteriales bacterium]|jgi:AcrR family transcriptional regulator|nr:helix-turn-helix domain-containing protein [Mycobacteriales bacterium]
MSTVAVRRTQAERSAATRARIIAATIDALVELGHAGTTTLEVQRRAEVSRGALLHHFPSRAELLVAAVYELFEAQRDVVGPEVLRAREIGGIDAGIDVLWMSFNSPLAIAIDELWSAARNDAELREAIAKQDRNARTEIRRLCAHLWPDYVSHRNYELALPILIDAMHGAARARVVRSDGATAKRLDAWKQLLHELWD